MQEGMLPAAGVDTPAAWAEDCLATRFTCCLWKESLERHPPCILGSWMCPGGPAAPGKPGSEQDYPEGLQHTEGSVLELGKAQEEAAAALE